MTAIIRRMDPLGRVVIPKSMREQLDWNEGDPIEVIWSDDGIYVFGKMEIEQKGAKM